jgi:hypothetical protein
MHAAADPAGEGIVDLQLLLALAALEEDHARFQESDQSPVKDKKVVSGQ